MNMGIEIGYRLFDKDLNLVEEGPFRKANSLVRAFIELLAVQMGQAALNITNSNNGVVSTGANSLNLSLVSNTALVGAIIGTGTTAVTIDDYKLETQVSANINHGYSDTWVKEVDANTIYLYITRMLVNTTASDVAIKEVGLATDDVNSAYYILLERTLINITFKAYHSLELTYRFKISL